MIEPYTAVGLIPTARGIRKRKDILRRRDSGYKGPNAS